MALKTIRIGSAVDVFQYDDADFDSGIEVDAPIKASAPIDPNDVVRLSDLDIYAEGPAISTDNAVARFDGVDGKLIQNSLVTIDDLGNINIPNGQEYKVNNVKVVTNQQAAELDAAAISAIAAGVGADTIDLAAFNASLTTLVNEINALRTTLNNILAKLRTHGLIDT